MDEPTTQAQFIGPKEVKAVETLPEKYNGTIDLVKVTYGDATTETMPKRLYGASLTPQATDLTALRQTRLEPLVKELLETMLSWGVKLADINFITQSIALSVNGSMNYANTKLWGKPENDLSLIDVDKILRDSTNLDGMVPPAA